MIKRKANKSSESANGYHKSCRTEDINHGVCYPNGYPKLTRPSNDVAKQYDENGGSRCRPNIALDDALQNQKGSKSYSKAILHWFRADLRLSDNRALSEAAKLARRSNVPLIGLYVASWQDWEWHGTSAARIDFELRTLEILKKDLMDLNVPLVIIEVDNRTKVADEVIDFAKLNGVSHIFFNRQYEVDECRRDVKLVELAQVVATIICCAFHDQTLILPGDCVSASNKPIKVFTPFHSVWLSFITKHSDCLELPDSPKKQKRPDDKLFNSNVPKLKGPKQLDNEHQQRLKKMWPAGEHRAQERLENFLDKQIDDYRRTRDLPSLDSTSRLSVHLSAGTISPRKCVKEALKRNSIEDDSGVAGWVRQIAFRDFYRQMMVLKPYTVMHKPANLKFEFVDWREDYDGWKRWCEGRTGYPYVDACMRQMLEENYMHNRGRMVTASFLSKNLLIDYRWGERFFMENLIDGDYANNNFGHQPDFTVMSPLAQSEKFDKEGEFIRRYVQELAHLGAPAIHDPKHRLSDSDFQKLHYPEPCCNFSETKVRAIDTFKQAFAAARG